MNTCATKVHEVDKEPD